MLTLLVMQVEETLYRPFTPGVSMVFRSRDWGDRDHLPPHAQQARYGHILMYVLEHYPPETKDSNLKYKYK